MIGFWKICGAYGSRVGVGGLSAGRNQSGDT